ncbi:MAG: hypothetical protein B7Y07_07850 [Halothiobacillus sp. 24-54-40]|jgi:uncharacterized protein (TIGR00251 family)|nr:MAG: hypothetical protein B7Y58_06675 [Halothiobacillus sp. 35-54-62]OYZ86493.1 MAG: hypothetical protein B7Y07_07850 [Halothiobacillus sp. 24-54-40]OZA80190.1 MAG: hypothetical protein B7X64_06960 [Halothiobacillus sp. 39-53-45]HQS01569.1 DUF167 family protein [Halothiobacillus sp.]HQS28146.1 DUF167 family protein [Halothiobacillus sp.]
MGVPDAFFHWQNNTLVLRLKVQPRASRNAWGEVMGDRIKLYLTTPPVEGKANAAVIAFVAKEFGVAKNQVHLHRGDTGRDKELHVQAPKIIPPLSDLTGWHP